MTDEQRKFLDRIHAYAEEVLADIDPQKTKISFQLEKLKPIMEEIATETGRSIEDVFIEYMDLASTDAATKELKLQSELGNL